MDSIVTPANFDITKLSIKSAAKGPISGKGSSPGKTLPFLYNDRPFVLKVPKMYIPLIWDKDETNTKYSVEFSFRGDDDNEGVAAFRKMLHDIDEYILTKAQERSVEWFKKSMSRETCEFMFSPTVRMPSDPAYAPTFKATIYRRNNRLDVDAFDENKEKLDLTDPHKLKGTNAMAIVQFTGVWFAGAKFGASLKVNQLRVFPRTRETGNLIDRIVPLQAADISVNSITFSAPKTTGNGGKAIYVNYNDKPLLVQTPEMHAPFGMSVWQDDAGSKFSTELSFRDAESNPDIAAFHSFISDLETLVKAESATSAWFKTSATYTSILRQNNAQYPANMKFTVPSADGRINIPIINADTDEEMEISENNIGVFKGSKMSIIASCTGVWNHGTRFGISFRALKILLRPNMYVKAYSLADGDDEPGAATATATAEESGGDEAAVAMGSPMSADEDELSAV